MARRKKIQRETMSTPYVFRLPKATAEQYTKLAEEFNMTMSQMLRKVLRERKHFTLKKERLTEFLQIMRLMSKSSNNLNQIAHHLNSLHLQGKLAYDEFIHYLRILDTIEAQNHLLLDSVKNHKQFDIEKRIINRGTT